MIATRSPSATLVTPAPVATTSPANSCPRICGFCAPVSGCGSTGWVYALLASHQWLIACFSKAAQDEVWQERTALAAGTYAPGGQAVAAPCAMARL